LREVLASESKSITVVECADKVAVDGPLDVVRGPIDGIGVPSTDRVSDIVVDGSIVGRSVALAKEVALHRCISRTQPFPIDLVEVIRFKNETADNTSAWGSPHNGVDLSKEDIFIAADRGSTCLGTDCKLCTVRSVVQRCSFCQ
jgi:hypothetical protein